MWPSGVNVPAAGIFTGTTENWATVAGAGNSKPRGVGSVVTLSPEQASIANRRGASARHRMSIMVTLSSRAMNWIRTLTPMQRRALFAAMLGWMFNAMDFLIYVLAIGRIKTYFGFGDATAGFPRTLLCV